MAKEIGPVAYTTGSNLYAVITSAVGTYANGTTPEAFNAAHWTSYAVALTELASSGGQYFGDFPALTAGVYAVQVFLRAGGSPATSDAPPIAAGEIQWSGTAEVPLSSRLATAGYTAPDNAAIAAAVRDVSNGSPAPGSLGEAVRGADAKAADIQITLGAPAVSVSADIAAIQAKTTNLPGSPAAVGSPMTLADGAITTAKFAAGATLPRVTLVDTTTDLTNGLTVDFPTVVLTGSVAASPSPTATGFTVTLDVALNAGTVAADFVGLYLTFTDGARLPVPGLITGCVKNSSTSVALTFAASTFAAAPAAADTVLISG